MCPFNIGHKQETLIKNISEKLQKHYASVFEQVCKEILWDIHSDIGKIGRWWHGGEEIDIIGLNEEKNTILFGECKWSKNKVDVKILEDLKQKTKDVKWKKDRRKEKFILFSKSGFTKELEDVSKENTNIELYDMIQLNKVVESK